MSIATRCFAAAGLPAALDARVTTVPAFAHTLLAELGAPEARCTPRSGLRDYTGLR
jgi:hypothetical protein